MTEGDSIIIVFVLACSIAENQGRMDLDPTQDGSILNGKIGQKRKDEIIIQKEEAPDSD